jgi:hypothetical protein
MPATRAKYHLVEIPEHLGLLTNVKHSVSPILPQLVFDDGHDDDA